MDYQEQLLGIVAIVVSGLLFLFSPGGAKRMVAGIVFGVGLAVGAARFLTWIF